MYVACLPLTDLKRKLVTLAAACRRRRHSLLSLEERHPKEKEKG
jgi:hypothetical protein